MHPHTLVRSLEAFVRIIPALVEGLAERDAHWRPDDKSWSFVEIVRHLADEEIEDFRPRLESLLRNPEADWAPIDPERWARDRHYQESSLHEAVELFLERRRANLDWLRGRLEEQPDWSQTKSHPRFGSMQAGELLAAWAAHDALHARQIIKRRHQLIERDAEPFSTGYAGEWKA